LAARLRTAFRPRLVSTCASEPVHLTHPKKWLPQQPEARSRRRSGRRARVRDRRRQHTHTSHAQKNSATQKPPTHPYPTQRCACYEYSEDAKLTSPAVKDKAQHAVVLDKNVTDKLNKDVQSYRLITVATLVDRLKINGSLARKALQDLEANGQIKKVVSHSKLAVYSAFPHPEGARPNQKPPKLTTRDLARAVGDAE
jgi:small subunit ribosomal protein S25e